MAQFYKSKQHFKFFKSSYFCFPNLYLCEYLSKPFIRITTVKGVTTIEVIETMFCLWSFLIIFTKQPTNSGFSKMPRKINLLLSLAKRKLAEKNEWNLSNQSGEVTHASIYLTNCRRSFFFSVVLFRAWFNDNQFSKIICDAISLFVIRKLQKIGKIDEKS